ncbi:MAG: hypothetical protein AAF529_21870 [Pseudomonadota bacterium]
MKIRLASLLFACGCCYSTLLWAEPYDAIDMAVSMQVQVDPGTEASNWDVYVGRNQGVDITDLIGPDGAYVLRVRTINASLVVNPAPTQLDYALLGFGRCSNGSTSGFGGGLLSVAAGASEHVTYNPGLVADLPLERWELCVMSGIQSTARARVQVHGYLQPRK